MLIVSKKKGSPLNFYFLGIDNGEETMEQLWDTKLYPLLKDYFRGEHKATEKLEIRFVGISLSLLSE